MKYKISNTKDLLLFFVYIILFLAFLYAIKVFNSFYEGRYSYLYHPDTGRTYKILLVRDINIYDKKTAWSPFNSYPFATVFDVEYLGKIKSSDDLLSNDKLMSLVNETPKLSLTQTKSSVDTDSISLQFYDLMYLPRTDLTYKNILPLWLSELLVNEEVLKTSEIIVVDAVTSSVKLKPNGKAVSKPKINVLRKALLFKGEAAAALSESGF